MSGYKVVITHFSQKKTQNQTLTNHKTQTEKKKKNYKKYVIHNFINSRKQHVQTLIQRFWLLYSHIKGLTGRRAYIILPRPQAQGELNILSWRAPTLAPPVLPNVKHETSGGLWEGNISCITSPTSSQWLQTPGEAEHTTSTSIRATSPFYDKWKAKK